MQEKPRAEDSIQAKGADGGRRANLPPSDSISTAAPSDGIRLKTENKQDPIWSFFFFFPAPLEEVLL